MTDNIERVESRLDNIKAIEPLLAALRTISMSTWQLALKKLLQIKDFEKEYVDILFEILPKLDPMHRSAQHPKLPEITDTAILIIGTERGLCGKFNKNLVDNALSWINSHHLKSYQIWAMGQRLIRDLERKEVSLTWRKSLPAGSLLDYQYAHFLMLNWLEQYEAYAFNRLIVMFNQTSKGNRIQFSTLTLLPFEFHPIDSSDDDNIKIWPPSIIETSAEGIYHQIIQHSLAATFYRVILESAAAEHSTRFNMMEDAKNNADEIMRDLSQVLNNERKRQITKEMQELATGSGLLEKK
jgi:F-type H+-transporting ATPase subunit gamma